jgi:VanZ family protein
MLCLPDQDVPEWSWRKYIPYFDKWAHGILFAILGFLFVFAMQVQLRPQWLRRHSVWIAMLSSMIYGLFTEVMQGLLKFGRTADPLDFVADATGVILGIAVFLLMRKFGRRRS